MLRGKESDAVRLPVWCGKEFDAVHLPVLCCKEDDAVHLPVWFGVVKSETFNSYARK